MQQGKHNCWLCYYKVTFRRRRKIPDMGIDLVGTGQIHQKFGVEGALISMSPKVSALLPYMCIFAYDIVI